MKTTAHLPEQTLSFYDTALGHFEAQQYPEAIEHLDTALALDPNNNILLHALGMAHRNNRDFPRAIASFEAAIRHGSKEAYSDLSEIYLIQQNYDQTIHYATLAITENPDGPVIAADYNRRALAYAFQDNYTKAIPDFETAVTKSPESKQFTKDLGIAKENAAKATKQNAGQAPAKAPKSNVRGLQILGSCFNPNSQVVTSTQTSR